jgi:hypothetical protein
MKSESVKWSTKFDGDFWQSEILCCEDNPFLHIILTLRPVLALNFWYVVFTDSIITVSYALRFMMSHETGIPFYF